MDGARGVVVLEDNDNFEDLTPSLRLYKLILTYHLYSCGPVPTDAAPSPSDSDSQTDASDSDESEDEDENAAAIPSLPPTDPMDTHLDTDTTAVETDAPTTTPSASDLQAQMKLYTTYSHICQLLKSQPSLLTTKFRIRDEVQRFVRHTNEGAQVKVEDADGFFLQNDIWLHPLHIASSLGLTKLVKLFMEWDETSAFIVKEKSENMGWLPLHMAVLAASIDCVELLYEAYPEAISRNDNKYTRIPHHIAARISNPSWEHNPELTPVDKAMECLTFLIQKYPGGLKVSDAYGWMPLHHSAYAATVPLIDVILKSLERNNNNDLVKVADMYGRLPLHLAADKGSLENVEYLYNAYPEAISESDDDMNAPLHHACMVGTCTSCILFLLEKFPEAAKWHDRLECFPIHHAVCNASSEVIAKLLEIDTKGLKVKDDTGKLPLHLCVQKNNSPDVVQSVKMLVEAFPESVGVLDGIDRTDVARAATGNDGVAVRNGADEPQMNADDEGGNPDVAVAHEDEVADQPDEPAQNADGEGGNPDVVIFHEDDFEGQLAEIHNELGGNIQDPFPLVERFLQRFGIHFGFMPGGPAGLNDQQLHQVQVLEQFLVMGRPLHDFVGLDQEVLLNILQSIPLPRYSPVHYALNREDEDEARKREIVRTLVSSDDYTPLFDEVSERI